MFGQGSANFAMDIEAVTQAIKTKLLLLIGEWWEDSSKGLPLFQTILLQRQTAEGKLTIDTVARERILETPGVTQIVAFESGFLESVYWMKAEVYTIYSQSPIEIRTELGT
jgi:hypothetical protein